MEMATDFSSTFKENSSIKLVSIVYATSIFDRGPAACLRGGASDYCAREIAGSKFCLD